jgi:hypothetical protein
MLSKKTAAISAWCMKNITTVFANICFWKPGHFFEEVKYNSADFEIAAQCLLGEAEILYSF